MHFELLFLLLAGHALADYSLQSAHMVEKKNRSKNPDTWFHYMAAHALMHGAIVYLITQSFVLGMLETVLHFAIDTSKCEGKIGFHVDQLLHYACKVVWWVFLTGLVAL